MPSPNERVGPAGQLTEKGGDHGLPPGGRFREAVGQIVDQLTEDFTVAHGPQGRDRIVAGGQPHCGQDIDGGRTRKIMLLGCAHATGAGFRDGLPDGGCVCGIEASKHGRGQAGKRCEGAAICQRGKRGRGQCRQRCDREDHAKIGVGAGHAARLPHGVEDQASQRRGARPPENGPNGLRCRDEIVVGKIGKSRGGVDVARLGGSCLQQAGHGRCPAGTAARACRRHMAFPLAACRVEVATGAANM